MSELRPTNSRRQTSSFLVYDSLHQESHFFDFDLIQYEAITTIGILVANDDLASQKNVAEVLRRCNYQGTDRRKLHLILVVFWHVAATYLNRCFLFFSISVAYWNFL